MIQIVSIVELKVENWLGTAISLLYNPMHTGKEVCLEDLAFIGVERCLELIAILSKSPIKEDLIGRPLYT
jgi:hypothetical protein